jgi:predicted transcriptional regulator
MAIVINSLVKGNKLCFRRKIPKENQDSYRCIEKLLIQSEQNSVTFLCILTESPYYYNFGTDAIIDMLTSYADKKKEPFTKVLIEALDQDLLRAIDPAVVEYIKKTADNTQLINTILVTLDNFEFIGKFLNNFIPNELNSEFKIDFVLSFFTKQSVENVHGNVHEMMKHIHICEESERAESDVLTQTLVSKLIHKCSLAEDGSVENNYLEDVSDASESVSGSDNESVYDDTESDHSSSDSDVSDDEKTKKRKKPISKNAKTPAKNSANTTGSATKTQKTTPKATRSTTNKQQTKPGATK